MWGRGRFPGARHVSCARHRRRHSRVRGDYGPADRGGQRNSRTNSAHAVLLLQSRVRPHNSNQVKSVFGIPVGQGRTILPHADGGPGGGKCEYGTANEERTLSFLFEAGTAASEKAAIPGPYVNEPSVGHGAFCVAKGFSVGWLYANVGTYNGSPQNLAIVDSTYSVKFARDAFARLF